MNIRRGLNRIAISAIACISLFFVVIGINSSWNKYQHSVEGLVFVGIPADLEKPTLSGWSFQDFNYKEAINAGYSDDEIVEFLAKKYNDFDLDRFLNEAKKVKLKSLFYNSFNSIFWVALMACSLYVFCLSSFYLIQWVRRGFKEDEKRNAHKQLN